MSSQPPGDLIRYSTTPLRAEQRIALGRLLDEIGFGIAIVARVEREHRAELGVLRVVKVRAWDSLVEEYARLLTEWPEGSTP